MSRREIEEDVKKAINKNYTKIIYKLDPGPVINHLRESGVLTVAGHDTYYEQLRNMRECGKTKADINEKLLEILYTRENWWHPFRRALHKCGAGEIAKIIEDAMAKGRRHRTRRHRSQNESESFQSAWAFSYSSGTKSLPLDARNASMGPINSEIIYSRESLTGTDQSPACSDEDVGHQYDEGMWAVQRESIESGHESDEKGETHLSPERHLGEADLGANLNDSGKPSLLPKHLTGTYEDHNQTGPSQVSGKESPVSGEERWLAMGNIPDIVPSEFPSSSSTEKQEILSCQNTDSVNSSQLFAPGDIQQPQDNLHMDTTKAPSLSEYTDEEPVEVEKYSSKYCLSERSENPSVHDRLAEEALNAQSINQSQDGQDGSQGTPGSAEVEAPADGTGEEPTVNDLENGGSPVGNSGTLTWRSIIEYSIMVLADSIIRG